MTYNAAQLAAVRGALAQMGIYARGDLGGMLDELRKATFGAPASHTTGINFYNLESLAKLLFNSYTPLRNMLPRRPGAGTGPNWRAVTRIDTAQLPMGVPDGIRGPFLAHEVKEFTGRYAEIDAGSNSTFMAVLAAAGFDDLRSIQAVTGLRAVQTKEEKYLWGGLGTYGLGTAPTVSGTPSNTGGALTAAASPYHIRVVALTAEGYRLRGDPVGSTAGAIATQMTLVSASPRATQYVVKCGASQISADATATIASGTAGSIAATVAAVKGAVAYAWFIGTSATNGTLAAITTVNKYTYTAVPAAGSPATGYFDTVGTNFNADNSQNQYVFDGLHAIMAATGSGSTITSLEGATLTSDGSGGIVELDALLMTMAQAHLVSPEKIWINFAQAKDIAAKITAGSASEKAVQIMIQGGDAQGALVGGLVATGYLNKFALDPARRRIDIAVHPDVTPGNIFVTAQSLPPVTFPDANIPGVLEVETLQEYLQTEWPLVDRQYETSVGVTEVLKCYAPFSLGLLQNVAQG